MQLNQKKILITGGAGFIGSTLVEYLLKTNCIITLVDNFDDFYDRSIKELNIASFIDNELVELVELNILDILKNEYLMSKEFDVIVHLAAKAGVRPSIGNPELYQQVNVNGTQQMLEFAKQKKINNFVFASSSSVYGINKRYPWREDDSLLNPISPYASTKVSCELLGHVYSHLYGIKFKGLRFFTVYGPKQRPDLAIHSFTQKIRNGQTIQVFGEGSTQRDYTYITDIVEGIISAIEYTKTNYEIFNLGNHETISLRRMIRTIESQLNLTANIEFLPDQPGDVPITFADISKAQALLDYHPKVKFEEGIKNFITWIKTLDA